MPTARDGVEFLSGRLGEGHWPTPLRDVDGTSGFAIVFGEHEFVVVTVEDDFPDHFAITCGVLKDVTNERIKVLEYCNTETANNPSMPIYSSRACI